MKISSTISAPKVNSVGSEPAASTASPFKDVLRQFVASEKAVKASTPIIPAQFKGLIELQRSSHVIQLQVECASRIADSLTSSIKKVQQLGGQG